MVGPEAFVIGLALSRRQMVGGHDSDRNREMAMGHYVGMDVGLGSSSLCIVDERGRMCLGRVASEIDEIAAAVRGFAEHVDGVALEPDPIRPMLVAASALAATPTTERSVTRPRRNDAKAQTGA